MQTCSMSFVWSYMSSRNSLIEPASILNGVWPIMHILNTASQQASYVEVFRMKYAHDVVMTVLDQGRPVQYHLYGHTGAVETCPIEPESMINGIWPITHIINAVSQASSVEVFSTKYIHDVVMAVLIQCRPVLHHGIWSHKSSGNMTDRTWALGNFGTISCHSYGHMMSGETHLCHSSHIWWSGYDPYHMFYTKQAILTRLDLSGMEYGHNVNMIALGNFLTVLYHWYGHIGSWETCLIWISFILIGVWTIM